MNTPAGPLLLACTVLLGGISALWAEEPPLFDPADLDRMSLEELLGLEVVAVAKTGVPLSRAPSWVTVIDRAQIEASAARSLPDLLRQVAGVNVRWNPMKPTITIRGFGQLPFSSRVLLLIDGVPQNSANKGGFRPQPLPDFFSLQHIERVEVIRGPGAALYGENAYWGVINVVTRSPAEAEGGSVELFAGDRRTLSAGGVWGRRWSGGGVLLSARGGRTQFAPQFWRASDSEVEVGDLLVKASHRGVSFSYYRYQDVIDGWRFPAGPNVISSVPRLEQSVDVATLGFRRDLGGGAVEVSGDLGFARRKGMYCGSCHATGQREEFARPASEGGELLGEVRLGWRPHPSHHLLVGVEGRRVDAGDKPLELLPLEQAGVRDYDYSKMAIWAQDRISLADDRLEVTLGLRYDGTAGDLFDDELSPRVALVWLPSDRVTLRSSWGTAFRFPSLSERYQASWWLAIQRPTGPDPVALFTPDPELRRERVETFELGGEVELSAALLLRAGAFHSTVEDFIVLAFQRHAGAPTTLTFTNHPDRARQWGTELELRFRPDPRIDAALGWAWQDVRQKGSQRDIAGRLLEPVYAPEHRLTLNGYLGPFGRWGGAVEASYVGTYRVPEFWAADGNLEDDGYLLLDARLDYLLPVPGGSLRLSLYGRDLLDEAPRETRIGFDSTLPGRELFGGVAWSF